MCYGMGGKRQPSTTSQYDAISNISTLSMHILDCSTSFPSQNFDVVGVNRGQNFDVVGVNRGHPGLL